MIESQIYSSVFYKERERLVREQIGARLDTLKDILSQSYGPCFSRLMIALHNKSYTLGELQSIEPEKRQAIVSSLMYNDALWRLEVAYLMLCVGVLNIAYSNLRSCLETIVIAHIIENNDAEAVKFLKGQKVEPKKIADFIPTQYNDVIKKMKLTLGQWGVHPHIDSILLGSFYGPDTFSKMLITTNPKMMQPLHPGFSKAANTCIQAVNDVFMLFTLLISKGKKQVSNPLAK